MHDIIPVFHLKFRGGFVVRVGRGAEVHDKGMHDLKHSMHKLYVINRAASAASI
jgi:hypothetical protein